MTSRRWSWIGLAAGFGAFSSPLSAHHSTAYYDEEVTYVVGELVEFQWENPHIRLAVETVNDRGLPEIVRMESNSLQNLRRAGITRDTFRLGEQVRIAGQRSTRAERSMLALSIIFPGEQEIVLWGTQVLYDDEARIVDAAAENRGIFRVWSVPSTQIGPALEQLADQPFTEAAISGRSSFDPLNNFATRCETEGMPRIMVNPHPFEFIDRGDEIILRTELYDIERSIHMDVEAPPDDAPWSRHGYSIGEWEQDGAVLVVRTTRVNWPFFDNVGTPQSRDVEIIERFTLSDDQTRLDFDITIIDPSTFTSEGKLVGYWLALGETIPRFDCQPNPN